MEVTRKSYLVTAQRDGRWWLLRVPELDVVTQTRRLARAEGTARDLIATWLGHKPGTFDVHVVPAVGDERLDWLVRETVEARSRADQEATRASALTH